MKVKGIILDETNLDLIRQNGFRDFKEVDGEMDDRDFEKYQYWLIKLGDELDAFTAEYMVGLNDAKVFYFSDKDHVVEKISSLFPACEVVETESEDYPLDYDYTRDRGRWWLSRASDPSTQIGEIP